MNNFRYIDYLKTIKVHGMYFDVYFDNVRDDFLLFEPSDRDKEHPIFLTENGNYYTFRVYGKFYSVHYKRLEE